MTEKSTISTKVSAALKGDAGGGLLLMAAAALSLFIVNFVSGGADAYHHLLHAETGPVLAPKLGAMTAHLWVNDGLMALFFLLVGLEIKREFIKGSLASWEQRRLPVIAAAAGMAVPAILYASVVAADASLLRGWAIPAATDIAFALGVLALLGPRVPVALKLLLTTIAIVDDLGAVTIIALFYSNGLDWGALAAAFMIWAVMLGCGHLGVRSLPVYMLMAGFLWYAVLLSGVHATVAGVLAALAIPMKGTEEEGASALARLEHGLHPWVTYAILPLFGFANAGVGLQGVGWDILSSPLPLGVGLALFFGKQLGIFSALWLSVKSGVGIMPAGASWGQLYGLSLLCGIGFTMSLFIGELAFPVQAALVDQAKIGILAGSLLSALMGYAVLRIVGNRSPAH